MALNNGVEVISYVIVFKNRNPIDLSIGEYKYKVLFNFENKICRGDYL